MDENQLAPTRLGNAIRPFEEYRHERFRLDTQVATARTSVYFFVAWLYGHGVVAALALLALPSTEAARPLLVVTAIALCAYSALVSLDGIRHR
ncbi:hypothetical protein [Streptomyces niveus]